jgi:pyridinium-3,5-biscarboxylic acid mononucleotide synthase
VRVQRPTVEALLRRVAARETTIEEAITALQDLPLQSLGDHTLDTHRALRNGFVEVIYGEGKSLIQMRELLHHFMPEPKNILATRVTPSMGESLQSEFSGLLHDPVSRTLTRREDACERLSGTLAIVAAGSSDIPVAEEARTTAWMYGVETSCHYDVGAAGLQRILSRVPALRTATSIIVVAGMDGVLPTIVGGLVSPPIFAVPTSIGYGIHLKGLASLCTMLNSCSEGISVVNIDNGFGAACAALRVMRVCQSQSEK